MTSTSSLTRDLGLCRSAHRLHGSGWEPRGQGLESAWVHNSRVRDGIAAPSTPWGIAPASGRARAKLHLRCSHLRAVQLIPAPAHHPISQEGKGTAEYRAGQGGKEASVPGFEPHPEEPDPAHVLHEERLGVRALAGQAEELYSAQGTCRGEKPPDGVHDAYIGPAELTLKRAVDLPPPIVRAMCR
jgi:hypothetical protein